MSLLTRAVAMFLPTQNTNISYCASRTSILPFQNSLAHISWIYNYTHDVSLHNSCTVTKAVLFQCNIETQTEISGTLRSGLQLWGPGLWLQHTHKSNASVSRTFHSNEKYLETFIFRMFETLLLSEHQIYLHVFPNSLLGLLVFWSFFFISWLPVKQFNLLIWPRERFFCKDRTFQE